MNSAGLSAETYVMNGFVSQDSKRIELLVKKGLWLYFILLIFEGALRKWVLPALASPLLIVRDPLVLWILATAWRRNLLAMNVYIASMTVIALTGIYTAYFLGHGNIFVALFGSRILLLHFPLIFLIGKLFDMNDVIKLGKATLLISIPMTVLITLQFYSPQTSWVNRGVGGEGGAGFSGALNFFRPPGTFSFTNGTALFYGFVASFVCYFWFNMQKIDKFLLLASTLALLVAIPVSISRTLFFECAITMLFAILSVAINRKNVGRMLSMITLLCAGIILLSFTSYFNTASTAFLARFETANTQEGGINGVFLDRFLGGMVGAVAGSSNEPFFGYGLGMGTNVGSMLLSGSHFFLLSEGEWGRVIQELGPILGLAIILIRIKLTASLAINSYKSMLTGNTLPWMLLSFGLILLMQGGWAQPTSLGFCTIVTGLIIASSKV